MKQISTAFAIALATFLSLGCEHSTNNEPAPNNSGLFIVTPTNNAYVDGQVTVQVSSKNVGVSRIELYVNDELVDSKTSGSSEFVWNTSHLASNTTHTLKAVGYNTVNSYTTSSPVTVRIK